MSTATALGASDHLNANRVERARLVYRACLYHNIGLTALWLLLIITGIGGGKLFANYRLTLEQIAGTVVFMVSFWVIWSYGWYAKAMAAAEDRVRPGGARCSIQ